jgi:hypothetical protein
MTGLDQASDTIGLVAGKVLERLSRLEVLAFCALFISVAPMDQPCPPQINSMDWHSDQMSANAHLLVQALLTQQIQTEVLWTV